MEKKKILIVEDEITLLEMYALKLEKEGFCIQKALSGKAAWQLLKTSSLPDLILLDIIMPKMSGYEFLKAIKKEKRIKEIPVVFLTNLSPRPEEIAQSKKLGVIDYLIKSDYTPGQLAEKIKTYFK